MADTWHTTYAAMHRAGDAAFPPAALNYVLTVVRETSFNRTKPLTPAEITAAFRAKARVDFGPLLREVLADWGTRTAEDLGKVVILLGKYGCLTLEATDTVELFATDSVPLDTEAV